MKIRDAAVVLHLKFRLKPGCREAFLAYVAEAFPIFEAACDCRGVAYHDETDPDSIDEVFYYRTERDFRCGERLLDQDPRQAALLQRWRSLLDGAPQIQVQRKLT